MQPDLAREGALVYRCKQRDTAAFAELYEEYVNRIYRHVYYLVRSKAEAEDLTEQTFLQAWAAIGRYQSRGRPILSWLLAIAHNLVVSRFRHEREQGPLHESIPDNDLSALPEEAYFAKSQREEILQAILKLKPLERQVILLRFVDDFVDDMEYVDVAQILGKSINSIRVIQYRALRNLRKMAAVWGDEEP